MVNAAIKTEVPRLRKIVNLFQNLHNWGKHPHIGKDGNIVPSSDERFIHRWKTKISSMFVIDSSTKAQYSWIGIVSAAVLYNSIFILARATFWQLQNALPTMWLFFDDVADIIYFMDCIVHAHEAYLENGLMVKDLSKLRKNYFHSPYFIWDVVSLVPFDFQNPDGICRRVPCPVIWRLNRLFRVHRLMEFLNKSGGRTDTPNIFEIAKLTFYILVLIHWNACLYFGMSYYIGFGADKWVFRNVTFADGGRLFYQYTYCTYWSTMMLTMISEVNLPENDLEYIFVIAQLLVGVILFAVIMGNVGSVIINMTATQTEFLNEMDKIKEYIKFQKLSKYVERRVIKWFNHMITQKQKFNEDRVLAKLPENLKMEIAMSLHLGTLKRIEMFQDCDPGLLTELVLKLKLQIFSPGDFVCRKGDIGKEMYIVKQGKVCVVSDDGKTIFVTLGSGSVFGEISLLNIPGSKTGNRRTANVRSIGYSNLFCLSKDDLWDTLREYPEAQTALMERGRQMLIKSGLMDENKVAIELKSEERLDNMETLLKILAIRLDRLSAVYLRSQHKFSRRLGNLEKGFGEGKNE